MKTAIDTNTILLTHYCEAIHIPLCLFQEKELVRRLPAHKDFNLPLLLMGCLEGTLPLIWYSDTPEHLFFGSLRLEATGETIFLGPVMPFSCSPLQADHVLSHIGRNAKDRQALLNHFAGISACDAPTLQANLRFLDYLLNGRERDVPHGPYRNSRPCKTATNIP